MRNAIIVHGCPSDKEKAMSPERRTYDKHWIPWLKEQLIAHDIQVEVPLMPEPWEPVYEKFKSEFEKYSINEKSILVGHSCGGAFLIRWLGESMAKVDKLILVAPWRIPDGRDEARKKYYLFPIDKTIGSRVNEIVMFISDNEADEGKESLKIYHEALGGRVIELKDHGHFTQNGMHGRTDFPELLKECLND